MKKVANSPNQPIAKNGKDTGKLKAVFLGELKGYEGQSRETVLRWLQWLIFGVLLFVEVLLVLGSVATAVETEKWWDFVILITLELVLAISVCVKKFAIKVKTKVWFYVLDVCAAFGLAFIINTQTYAVLIYLLVLTELYLSAEKPHVALICYLVGIVTYAICYLLKVQIRDYLDAQMPLEAVSQVISQSLGAIASITLHFLIMQTALAFYRQFVKLRATLDELAESKQELEKAYEAVAEVTALEERQRIAKDIHDTAGHSITTVIMQTEAAKRIIDRNPEEAKNRLVAANLQARHALEELRDSVHLLSGNGGTQTLKTELVQIIRESSDGTGLIFRWDVDEVSVDAEKHRFLCNSLKEGVSNAIRHGGATAFWFECKAEEGEIKFVLSDNGEGRALDGLKLGFGLTAMQNRASALGGAAQFKSEQGEGFEIRITLPMEKEDGKEN